MQVKFEKKHMEHPITEEKLDDIVAFLSKAEIFQSIPYPLLRELAAKMSLISLNGGESLIKQHEIGDCMYLVMYGRLRVFIEQKAEGGEVAEIVVGEVSPGQLVGEIALLLNQPRSANVQAMRDSILVKLTKEAFDKFAEKSPDTVLSVARMCVKKLVEKKPPMTPGANVKTVVIAPAGSDDSSYHFFAKALVDELKQHALTLFISPETIRKIFGRDLARSADVNGDNDFLIAWLHQQESNYRYIIYETDPTLTPWTWRCLRQADRIMLVSEADSSPMLNEIEIELASKEKNAIFTELILLHKSRFASNTKTWLHQRLMLRAHHHLDLNTPSDLYKLARSILGKTVGLVFSGGGAKGLSYPGVVRAFKELKIPIDYVAGTSIGAIFAALTAKEISWEQQTDLVRRFAEKYEANYTFPFLSISSGRYLSAMLKEIMGEEQMIEDLWRQFFCVSTDLMKASSHIHDQGLLWKAVRASTSLPAIFPPMRGPGGELLVDGGVLNNLPVDILRQKISGGKIIAVTCNPFKETVYNYPLEEPSLTGWGYLKHKYNQRFLEKEKQVEIPTIYKIIQNTLVIGSQKHELQMCKDADFLLEIDAEGLEMLDFKSYKGCLDLGYRIAMEHLPVIIKQLPEEKL